MHMSVVKSAVLATLVVVGLVSTAAPSSATGILIHEYDLNGSYADTLGGPSLTPNGGTLGATGYTFGANLGPSLLNGFTDATNYSIVLDFSFTDTSGYRRIVDFENRTSDTGLYNLNGSLDFYPTASGASVISPNTEVQVVITRDSSTSAFTGYVNGGSQFSFTDTSANATFTGPNQIANFFIDDLAVPNEASAGFADEIRIYNGALTAGQVSQLSSPVVPISAVPEPASLILLGTGLVAVARRRFKKRV